MSAHSDSKYMTFTSAAALTAWKFVYLTTSGTVDLSAANGPSIIGVTTHACSSGDRVVVKLFGDVVRATAAAAISVGDVLYAGANGKLATSNSSTDKWKFIALEAATADAAEIMVLQTA